MLIKVANTSHTFKRAHAYLVDAYHLRRVTESSKIHLVISISLSGQVQLVNYKP